MLLLPLFLSAQIDIVLLVFFGVMRLLHSSFPITFFAHIPQYSIATKRQITLWDRCIRISEMILLKSHTERYSHRSIE